MLDSVYMKDETPEQKREIIRDLMSAEMDANNDHMFYTNMLGEDDMPLSDDERPTNDSDIEDANFG